MLDRLRQIPRSTLAVGAVALLLLIALGIKRTPPRPFLITEISIASQPIPKDAAVKAEAQWSSLEDVDVVGWALYAKTPGSIVTLLTPDRKVLARAAGGSDEIRPQFVTTGTGYRLRTREPLTLRLDVAGADTARHTHRTLAMVYYVPVR